MYLRFISPFEGEWWSCRKGIDCGLFQGSRIAREQGLVPSYLKDALSDELGWFNKNLAAPKGRYFDHRKNNVGICWFKEDAAIFVQRCWRIVAVLKAADVDISFVRTRNPGMILYSDRYQIIAKPEKSTPTKWGQTKKHFRR